MANFSVKTDTKISSGVVDDRSCTDLLCLLVFILFLGSMGFCTDYGIKNGDIDKMIAPIDGNGNFCGIDDYADYSNLYFTYLGVDIDEIFDSAVCVKSCPSYGDTSLECLDADSETCEDADVIDDIYDSDVIGTLCIPDLDSLEESQPDNVANWESAYDTLMSYSGLFNFNDLYLSSRAIEFSLWMSLFFSIVYIYLMSLFAEILSWICIFLTSVGLIAATVLSFIYWKEQNDAYSDYTSDEKEEVTNPKYILYGAITVCTLTFIYHMFIVCTWSALKMAINVIDGSADFLA